MLTTSNVEKDYTHLEKLNQRFKDQNSYMSGVIDSLIRIGHKLNDTNVPSLEEKNKAQESLPYGDGHLVNYYYQLNDQAVLSERLNQLLLKLDAAI